MTWILTLVWRDITQHRLRTILSTLAVAIGAAMVVATRVIRSGIEGIWDSGQSAMPWITNMVDIVFTAIGLIILVAAGFLIANAMGMAVTQQRRQIGLLRTLGLTGRQVVRQILLEALVVGLLGSLLGVAGGPFLGQAILGWMETFGLQVVEGRASLSSVALAVGMGLVIPLLAAWLPARRAARVAPLEAVRAQGAAGATAAGPESRMRPRLGLAMGAALLLYLLIAPPGRWSGAHTPWDWILSISLWVVWVAVWILLLPVMIQTLVRAARRPLCRMGGAGGRLIADNWQRASPRLFSTLLAFAVGVAMTVGVGGILTFTNDVLVARTAERVLDVAAWYVYPFDRTSGMAQLSDFDLEAMALDPEVVAAVYRLGEGRAAVGDNYVVQVPEIGSLVPGFPSFIMSWDSLAHPQGIDFNEGDWEQARPIMEAGCGLLLPPAVAARHGVGIGGRLSLSGLQGPVSCTVAGIGITGMIPASVISPAAAERFVPADRAPAWLSVYPLPGAEAAVLEADLLALADRFGERAWISLPEGEVRAIYDTSDQLQGMFNGLLLLAVVAAALGMINTMLMNVALHRRELLLLRAVGATRRQVTEIVVGEAAATGLLGALLGAGIGLGIGAIFVLAYGGITFGLLDLPLWGSVGGMLWPAVRSGWMALLAAPLLAAAAAAPAIRALLRGRHPHSVISDP